MVGCGLKTTTAAKIFLDPPTPDCVIEIKGLGWYDYSQCPPNIIAKQIYQLDQLIKKYKQTMGILKEK